MTIHATFHIQPMRGGSQGHLMRASDKNYYVVKFQNNPQHFKVLSNEFLATWLAKAIWLCVPQPAIIQVDASLIEKTASLKIQLPGGSVPCLSGLQFGSRYAIKPEMGQVFDYLPEKFLGEVENLAQFAGILAFDKWVCNADNRQAVFSRKRTERKYLATFIDQGHCFNLGEWSFWDSPLRGVYSNKLVYRGVQGWKSFEPWLTKIENMHEDTIFRAAKGVAPEWYGNDWDAMERLVDGLIKRRSRVWELIRQFKDSSAEPFPNWTASDSRRTLVTRRRAKDIARRSIIRRASDL